MDTNSQTQNIVPGGFADQVIQNSQAMDDAYAAVDELQSGNDALEKENQEYRQALEELGVSFGNVQDANTPAMTASTVPSIETPAPKMAEPAATPVSMPATTPMPLVAEPALPPIPQATGLATDLTPRVDNPVVQQAPRLELVEEKVNDPVTPQPFGGTNV